MLDRILAQIEPLENSNVMVGFETADDAGVYRLTDEIALVQTVDFFTPVVDDPFQYGAIAAANSLSDIYAMGAKPLFTLSVIGFPEGQIEEEVMGEIVRGGSEKMRDAGVPILGGHSVQDQEIKFGYCVTGIASPDRVFTNSRAREGDLLVLTKPLGTGIITTGVKFSKASETVVQSAVDLMLELNSTAASCLDDLQPHAVTDVTGFGLVGHAFEMARASKSTFVFEAQKIPVLSGVRELCERNCLPGGIMTNEHFVGKAADWSGVGSPTKEILLDPQTSGGLLVSIAEPDATRFLDALREKGRPGWVIGRVESKGSVFVRFENPRD